MKINPDIKSINKKIFSPTGNVHICINISTKLAHMFLTFLSEGGRWWWSYRWKGRWVRGRSSTRSSNICKRESSWICRSVYWGNYRNYRICLLRQCDILQTCFSGQNQVFQVKTFILFCYILFSFLLLFSIRVVGMLALLSLRGNWGQFQLTLTLKHHQHNVATT